MITYQGKVNKAKKEDVKVLRKISKETTHYYNILLEVGLKHLEDRKEVLTANELKVLKPKPNSLCSYHSEPVVEKVMINLKRFYKGDIGKPRFKNTQRDRWSISSTVYVSQENKVLLSCNESAAKICIPGTKIILNVRTDKREIKGTIKRVSVVKDGCGDLWVKLTTDHTMPFVVEEAKCEGIGTDLGCREFAVAVGITKEGTRLKLGHERTLAGIKKEEKKLEHAQKREDWRGVKHISRRIERKRKHYNHVLAGKLVALGKRVFIGDVSSRFLFSNPSSKVARQAGDAAHRQLRMYVGQKAARATAPREAYLVREAYTSKTCSFCRTKNQIGRLKFWNCHQCRTWHDRDVNSAGLMKYCEIKKDLCKEWKDQEIKYRRMRAQRSQPRGKRQASMPVGVVRSVCMEIKHSTVSQAP